MKLVFALIVMINQLPKNTDGMYFLNAEDCNKVAYETEAGYAGETENGKQQWKSPGYTIKAYCEPRLVDKNARTF